MTRTGQTDGTAYFAAPSSDYDPYTDQALLNPWPGYKRLRDAGPAVWLPKYRMFALTRYDSVRRALTEWESFQSHNGVMMNGMNQVLRATHCAATELTTMRYGAFSCVR